MIGTGADLARVRFLGAKIPVVAKISLNNRCHSRCSYCSYWYTPSNEMSTAEIVRIIDDLARLGTRRLTLSGGEPMLRNDIGEILAAAAATGMKTDINTTGFLFRKRKDALRHLDLVKFSLDGREEVHDAVRGRPGAFRELEEAIELTQEVGIPFSFAFTITKHNLGEIEFALAFAERHGTFVAFQPVMAHEHASAEVRDTFPDRDAYLSAIDVLMDKRRKGSTAVRNTLHGLEHIRAWPDITGVKCWAGDVFIMIEANGDVMPCDRIDYDEPIPNCREKGIAWAFSQLPKQDCPGCGFCGAVELNMLMAGRVDVLSPVLQVVRGAQ